MVNSYWLTIEKFVRLLIGFLTTAIIARYLGLEYFGMLSYAIAFISIFSAISSLGIDSLIVKTLSESSSEKGTVLCTAFLLKSIFTIVSYATICAAAFFFELNNRIQLSIILILALAQLFQPFDVLDLYYQSNFKSKIPVIARLVSAIICAVIKIFCVYAESTINIILCVFVLEAALTSASILFLCIKSNIQFKSCRWSYKLAKKFLTEGWPLILTSIVVAIYLRVDQIIIGWLLDKSEVGIYSVAVRLTEVWGILPMAITASALPVLMSVTDKHHRKILFNQLFLGLFWTALIVAILIFIFADFLVTLFFGDVYESSINVIKILCWSGIFTSMGLVSSNWYLLEKKTHLLLYRQLIGVVVNVALSLWLIPLFGTEGAAWSVLITQVIVSYLLDIANRNTRHLFYIKTKILFLFLPLAIISARARLKGETA